MTAITKPQVAEVANAAEIARISDSVMATLAENSKVDYQAYEGELYQGSARRILAQAKQDGIEVADRGQKWSVPLSMLTVVPGMNARDYASTRSLNHIAWLSQQIREHGFDQTKPIAGYIARMGSGDDARDVFVITDGHHRYFACLDAVSQGAGIEMVPVLAETPGTSNVDLAVSMLTRGTSLAHTPLEIAVTCVRLIRWGLTPEGIAKRVGLSADYVSKLVRLAGAPQVIRDMVKNEQLAAAAAIETIIKYGEQKAAEMLSQGLEEAKKSGKNRVTKKNLPGAKFNSSLKKSAPEMYEMLQAVMKDAAVATMDAALRARLADMLSQFDLIKAMADAGDGQEQEVLGSGEQRDLIAIAEGAAATGAEGSDDGSAA